MRKLKFLGAAILAGTACAAGAQTSNVTLYGSIDQYLNYMRSSSGTSIKGTEDGAYLRSRLGVRGSEDLGGGVFAKFQIEQGINSGTGAAADATRGWDRQAWVGLATPYGEFRVGRQNGVVFYRGDYIDFTSRTLGSIVNTFGVPSRYDNDLSYLSPRVGGFLFEAHMALGETTAGFSSQAVYQYGVDYLNGPFRVGYAGLMGKPPANAAQGASVKYDNLYANWDYGQGKVYLVYVHSNNNTSNAVSNNAGTILGNVGGVVAGTNADVSRFYNITQISVDYRITPSLRLGALWGQIKDTSHSGRDASGGVMGAYYDLSKRTMLLAMVDTLRNGSNGGFRPAASAGLPYNFSTPADINGKTINGMQVGIVHRF